MYIYMGTHIYYGILLSHKRNEILPFVILMDLEDIMLTEISQRKTITVCFHLNVESIKQNK